MTGPESGRVPGQVDVRSSHTAQVSETDVHGNTDTTLERATDVVAVPCDTLGYVGVDAADSEEAADVAHDVARRTKEHCPSSDGHEEETDHEDTTSLQAISKVSTAEGEEAGDDVWRHGHELGSIVGVAECSDDGGEEERDGVQRGVAAANNQTLSFNSCQQVSYPIVMNMCTQIFQSLMASQKNFMSKASERLLRSCFKRRTISFFSSAVRNLAVAG